MAVDEAELEVLTKNFHALHPVLINTTEKIDRPHFRDLLSERFGMTESLLMDRGASIPINLMAVFRVFDTDNDNHISFDEFIKGMSVFLKGKVDERLKCTHPH
jgi:Ca2+-binding EF-hand superfamily protein